MVSKLKTEFSLTSSLGRSDNINMQGKKKQHSKFLIC